MTLVAGGINKVLGFFENILFKYIIVIVRGMTMKFSFYFRRFIIPALFTLMLIAVACKENPTTPTMQTQLPVF